MAISAQLIWKFQQIRDFLLYIRWRRIAKIYAFIWRTAALMQNTKLKTRFFLSNTKILIMFGAPRQYCWWVPVLKKLTWRSTIKKQTNKTQQQHQRIEASSGSAEQMRPQPLPSHPGPYLLLLGLAVVCGRQLMFAPEALQRAVALRSESVPRPLTAVPAGWLARGAFGHCWTTTAEPRRELACRNTDARLRWKAVTAPRLKYFHTRIHAFTRTHTHELQTYDAHTLCTHEQQQNLKFQVAKPGNQHQSQGGGGGDTVRRRGKTRPPSCMACKKNDYRHQNVTFRNRKQKNPMNLLDPGLVGSGPTGAPDILWMYVYVNVFLCIENFSWENFYSFLAGPTGLRAISDATENQIAGFQNTMLGQLCLLLCFLVLLFQSTDFSQFSYKKERGTAPWNKLEWISDWLPQLYILHY